MKSKRPQQQTCFGIPGLIGQKRRTGGPGGLLSHLSRKALRLQRNQGWQPGSNFEGAPAQTGQVGARLWLFRHVWAMSFQESWAMLPPFREVWKREAFLSTTSSLCSSKGPQYLYHIQSVFRAYVLLSSQSERRQYFYPVIYLKVLNGFLRKDHFKMESLKTTLCAVRPRDWMLSIDLKDVYFRVPIHVDFQRFLRFVLGRVHYQFMCLPFCLTMSPHVFSKLLLALVALIRTWGIRIFHYVDDILLLVQSKDLLV